MINLRTESAKWLVCYLVVAIVVISVAQKAYAGFVPSVSHHDRSADLEKIQKVLELKMVTERLEQLGFTQQEIQMRLSQLSDDQVHQLALQLDDLRVGGNGAGVIIALLVIAILAVLLYYLLKKA